MTPATFLQSLFSAMSPSPFTHLYPSRGVRPRQGVHHDRFGSRRNTLRHAGAWPGLGAGGGQGVPARRSGRRGDQARSPDQARSRTRDQVGGDAALRRRRGVQAAGLPRRAADAEPDRRHRARRQRKLAAAGPHHFPDPCSHQLRTDLPAGARLHRRLYRLPARRQRRRRGRRAGGARPFLLRPQAVAPGAGHAAAVAGPARGRRRPRQLREAARRARLPAAGLHGEFGFGVAAGLLPVLRGSRQAHRFRAVPGAGRHRQTGAVVRGKAAVRRRPQARRALQHQSARRAAVRRQGKPAEIRRIQYLRPRSQAVRALHRTGLCAAAHRPAGHPAGQRQHPVGVGAGVPDRRPQPDQHGDRQRLPAHAEQLRAQRPRRRARRQGLVRRTCDRDHAQCRCHHRLPGGPGAG